MTTAAGLARTANARAARTARKHERWAAELGAAGRTVITAGHVTVHASVLNPTYMSPTAALHLWCERCDMEIVDCRDQMDVEMPLPAVLAAVNGHVCEVKP